MKYESNENQTPTCDFAFVQFFFKPKPSFNSKKKDLFAKQKNWLLKTELLFKY